MMHQLFVLTKHINNNILKTGTALPNDIKDVDFKLSLNDPAHSEVLTSMKLWFFL